MADSVDIDTMLTPEQEETIRAVIGISIVAEFASIIVFTFFHGVFILLFFTSSISMLRQGLGSCSKRAMFSLMLICFITATAHCAAYIAGCVIEVQSILSGNLDMPLIQRLQLGVNFVFAFKLIILWTQGVLTIISDIIVIWRAWVLFFENRWVMIGPLALLLGTIITTLLNLIPLSNFNVYVATDDGPTLASVINKLRLASFASSLATNALATLMITYKLWQHRAFLIKMLGANRPRSRVQNVLIIIIEAGMLYFVLQLGMFVLGTRPDAAATIIAENIYVSIYYELTAMYPTIIIEFVNHQRSLVDTYGFTNVDLNGAQTHGSNAPVRRATVGHLSFVRHRTSASSDDLDETQNLIGENNADGELDVSKTRFLNGTVMVDVDVEKRQAKTAPF